MALAVLNHSSPDLSYMAQVNTNSPALQDSNPRSYSPSSSSHAGGEPARDPPIPPYSSLREARTDTNIDFNTPDLSSVDGDEAWKTLDNIAAIGLTLEKDEDDLPSQSVEFPDIPLGREDQRVDRTEPASHTVRPFHKWMKTLQRRAHRPSIQNGEDWMEAFSDFTRGGSTLPPAIHRKSSSGSSFDFVAAVKSASVSIASASVITRRRHHAGRSSTYARTERSGRASLSAPRCSDDSACFEDSSVVDAAVTERLLQRRRILEELISTEESYIGDVKFLMNVYVTILASLPTSHPELRSSINRNLTDIVELHEEILGDLHRVVPNSEYTQPERPRTAPHKPTKEHHRWHSLDSVPEDKGGESWLQSTPGMTTDPSVAAQVAHVFGKRINRFFLYEEYGAKYELMIRDVASAHRMLPQWETYQRGLEALAASLGSSHQHVDHSKKSLTIGDLLVKPIQRICRYPLLFAEILKFTPVCDCPHSHMEIANVLIRLREATAAINRATDNPGMKARIEATWLLQDRLAFPNLRWDSSAKTTIRSFGQIELCGALHVCWQSRDGVNGQYMVTLLYKDCLVLATASKADQTYTIQACISFDSIRVEDADNGRGLQCHTAPFSWKLVFECDHQLYEIIMTACTPKEEAEWRTRLKRSDTSDPLETTEVASYSTIYLDIKSLGTVFGKPGSVARRVSIHRATTVGPRSTLCQVILKNTTTLKDTSASSRRPINRSQSLLTTNSRTPVLTPSRGERARLESLLADVWSRTDLPFPGFTTRSRSEQLVRSSATTVMRKLSVANFTSSLGKRSTSVPTMAKANDDTLSHIGPDTVDAKDSDGSGCMFTQEDNVELSKKPGLPSIRDGSERSNSIHSNPVEGDCATLSGTVRKVDLAKLDSAWPTADEGFGAQNLRASSANSTYPNRGSSPSGKSDSSAPSPSPGKENRYQKRRRQDRFIRSPLSGVKSSGKWTRVNTIKREMVASGLRSLFR